MPFEQGPLMTYLTAAHVCRETCRPGKLSTTHTLHDIRKDLVIIEAVKELGGTPKDEQVLIWQEVMKHRTSGAACCQASSPEATNPVQKCGAKSYKLLTTTTMTVPSADSTAIAYYACSLPNHGAYKTNETKTNS
jgi:hypothetical protein